VLIDGGSDEGVGIAYPAGPASYLLNVPAGQMSIDTDRPAAFLDFALARGNAAGAQEFLPRAFYGEYLRASLRGAAESTAVGRYVRVKGRALRVRPPHDGARSWQIHLDDRRVFVADEVVLAIGNAAPAHLPPLGDLAETGYYVHDPWGTWPPGWSGRMRRVLVLGTGLTMADVALRLARAGRTPPEILALSRHGRLPQQQTSFDRAAMRPDRVATIGCTGGSLRGLVRVVHAFAREAEATGGDWREVVNAVRGIAPELWARLDGADRRRFLRHVRPVWDAHRHRIPAAAAAELFRLQASGRLAVSSGFLESAAVVDHGVEVIWRPRGASQRQRWLAHCIFNCTGPDSRVANSEDPLVRSLLADGLMVPDPLELGILASDAGEVIGAGGRPVAGLYYIGPWLRARDWEATAVRELRSHATRLAALIGAPRELVHRPRVARGEDSRTESRSV